MNKLLQGAHKMSGYALRQGQHGPSPPARHSTKNMRQVDRCEIELPVQWRTGTSLSSFHFAGLGWMLEKHTAKSARHSELPKWESALFCCKWALQVGMYLNLSAEGRLIVPLPTRNDRGQSAHSIRNAILCRKMPT